MGTELRLSAVKLSVKCILDLATTDIVEKFTDCKLEFHPVCKLVGSAQFTILKNKTSESRRCRRRKEDNAGSIKISKKRNLVTVGKLDEDQEELKQRFVTLEQKNERLTDELKNLKLQVQFENNRHPADAGGGHLQDSREDSKFHRNRLQEERCVDRSPTSPLFSRKHAHPPLIVQFTSRMVREMWLAVVRVKRNVVALEIATSFPATKVFIIEHLTPSNKSLLGWARRLREV
ncbi:hypothetical protein J6590_009675 [Homalodisca vitripennis]|nr:hypothetical protein J6590_009675 [Homalodisca vitripennis]